MENRFKGETIAAYYRKYRPSPPPKLKATIIDYLAEKVSPPFHHAIDVGCGSGQSTRILSDAFDQVTGADVSEDQIRYANEDEGKPQNVTFRVGTDAKIPCEDASTELITVAMAIHWFDLEKFYQEVDRVLKPGGCLAIYSYNLKDIIYQGRKSDAATQMYTIFIRDGYSHPRHQIIFNGLKDVKLPYEDSKRVNDQYLEISTNIRGVVGDLQSDSSYRAYTEAHPEDTQFLARYQDKLLEALGYPEAGAETPVVIRHPVALLLSRKPRK